MLGIITIIIILFLVAALIWGCYVYDRIENFYIPYEETEHEKKNRINKERYTICSLQLLSK